MSRPSYDRPVKMAVVGTSGSGKTSLAKRLSRQLGLPHVELDALYHRERWTHVTDEELVEQVKDALLGSGWVVDGNYSMVRDIVWSRADAVVWLDYPRWFVMQRVVRRTLGRALARTELWHGNRERPLSWLNPDAEENIILWAWTTHQKNRERYQEAFADPRWAGKRLVRLRTAQATEQFVAELRP